MPHDTSRPPTKPPKLLARVRAKIRTLHYSYRTEKAYLYWIRQFILFSGRRHPKGLGKADVERFLSHLAVDRRVAASTQNQALGIGNSIVPNGPEVALRRGNNQA